MSQTPAELLKELTSDSAHLPTKTLFQLALAGLRVRIARSTVTMVSVVLAIAYLSYTGTSNSLIYRLAVAETENETIASMLRDAQVNAAATRAGNPLDHWLVAMALLTCTVGIANAMLMSVTERFREIGTMKCLGAEDSTIVKLFLIESSLLGVVGSLCGIILGLIISMVVGLAQFGMYAITYASPLSILLYVGFSFVSGIILCLIGAGYPALVAARMRPVEALRVEE